MGFLKGYTTYTGGLLLILTGLIEIVAAINDGAISVAEIESGAAKIGAGVAVFGFRRNQPDKGEQK